MKKRYLDKNRLDIYNDWVNNKLNNDEKIELNILTDDEKYDAFFKDLEFGTGGIRAVIGPGTNRLNRITVSKFAHSYSLFLKKHNKSNDCMSVVIGYDTRLYSKEFANIIASILLSNNIKVFKFDTFVPTPILSFAVKRLNCDGGVMITASHNPFYYNGIKVYSENGGQILENDANEISILLKENDDERSLESYYNPEIIGEQIVNEYLYEIKKIDKSYSYINKVNVIYSPLHGACINYCNKVLDILNVNYVIVSSQNNIDPYFSSVKVPNPESIDVYKEGIRYLKDFDSDCIIVSDPDGDRLGVIINDKNSLYHLNGSELGALIINYLCEIKKYNKGFVVSSIVTNNLGKNISIKNKLKYYETLTGFKYINNKIKEEINNGELVLGYEESCGYLLNSSVGDKDSFQAMTITLNMIAYYKNKGKTLVDVLDNIYKDYGYYTDTQIIISSDCDLNIIKNVIENSKIYNLIGCFDYNNLVYFDYLSKNKKIILDFPKANVLKYILDDNSFIAVRPSGTELKVKIYISYCDKTKENSLKKVNEIIKEINNVVGGK